MEAGGGGGGEKRTGLKISDADSRESRRFGEGVSLNSPTRKRWLTQPVGSKAGSPECSRVWASEGQSSGAHSLSWAHGDSVDSYASSPQEHGPWTEISGAVQGATNADPWLDIVIGEGGAI